MSFASAPLGTLGIRRLRFLGLFPDSPMAAASHTDQVAAAAVIASPDPAIGWQTLRVVYGSARNSPFAVANAFSLSSATTGGPGRISSIASTLTPPTRALRAYL